MTGSTHPRTVLVTGCTSGIGFATAVELARRGCHVLVHGRTAEDARAALEDVRQQTSSDTLEAVWADLAIMAEVRALAARLLDLPRLDVVIHNAGLERWERQTTSDGFELTFAVNQLAPFLLTRLLVPALARSRPSRVLFVSSVVHRWGRIHWDDLHAERWYSPEPVYYQSKLASALTAQAFTRRLEPLGISVLLVPPGLTRTSFGRDFRGFAALWSRVVGALFFREPQAVARELTEVALSDRFAGVTGAYVHRLKVGLPGARARIPDDQERMWRVSCELLHLAPDVS